MPEFQPGTYIIVPDITPVTDKKSVDVGPNPRTFPPPDEAATIKELRGPWVIRAAGDDLFTLSAKRGSNDYKWTVKNDILFFSRPGSLFRIDSAVGVNGLWVIGIPDRDALLTADPTAQPQLTFRPADGSDAQLYKFIPVLGD